MSISGDIVIFIGPPGAGKGSLSYLCVQQLGWTQLSTGNLCRKHIAEKTPLGQRIDFAIKSGKLIEDAVIIALVEDWLKEYGADNKAVILDGFPRTVFQAEALHQLLSQEFPKNRLYCIKMNISDSSVISRLTSRFICQNNTCQAVYSTLLGSGLKSRESGRCDHCHSMLVTRSDDNLEAISKRLALYNKSEHELLDYYRSTGKLIGEIDVEKPLQDVFQDLIILLKQQSIV